VKDTFTTIASPSEGTFKEKGSKFLAYAYPIRSEDDIPYLLHTLATQHFDARHHCYAWRLGPEGKRYRTHDAGEPNHSAGDPILNAMKSRNLLDILVVVVRYFGGTKLGIPGLIEAYGTAAAEALDAAQQTERILTQPVKITFTYPQTAEVGRVLQKYSIKPTESQYAAACHQSFDVRLRDLEAVKAAFQELGILESV
jgi:uncharacterized YigZ family protein